MQVCCGCFISENNAAGHLAAIRPVCNGAKESLIHVDAIPRLLREDVDACLQQPVPDNRPLVSLCYAQSLDGSIAAKGKQPLALSAANSMLFTHYLRSRHDAILIGIGTLIADNPQLNVRLLEGVSPQPVVVDSELRFPANARLLSEASIPPWIAVTSRAAVEERADLKNAGALFFCCPQEDNGWVDIAALLGRLREHGIRSVMVEGGARIIASFLRGGLADQLFVTIAPCFVGGELVVPIDTPALHFPQHASRRISWHSLGKDVVLHIREGEE